MNGRIKLRDEISDRLFEDLIYKAADAELDALDLDLESLVVRLTGLNVEATAARTVARKIENAAGLYAAALAEAAFVAGLDCGRDLRLLVCKPSETIR